MLCEPSRGRYGRRPLSPVNSSVAAHRVGPARRRPTQCVAARSGPRTQADAHVRPSGGCRPTAAGGQASSLRSSSTLSSLLPVAGSRPVSGVLSGSPASRTPWMTIHLCDQPGSVCGRTALSLLDLAPGGVCLAVPVARDAGALLPHRFTLTGRADPTGGLFSVALSCESPRLAQASTLSCGAPTFLNPREWAAVIQPAPRHRSQVCLVAPRTMHRPLRSKRRGGR